MQGDGNRSDFDSVTTVYRRAVPVEGNVNSKRISTSSEDDEQSGEDTMNNLNLDRLVPQPANITYGEILDSRLKEHREAQRYIEDGQKPSTSTVRKSVDREVTGRSNDGVRSVEPLPTPAELAKEETRKMIRRAESAKALMHEVPGKKINNID